MKQFFQDSKEQYSMVRLLSFILVISGIVCAFVTENTVLSSSLIGFGIGAKVGQKFQEK